jgi:peptide/nickel transport system permease protein
MGNYILKQFIQAILILFGVISVTFALLYVIPGDPAKLILGQRADATSVQTVREELGLNQPVYIQYLKYISKAARGDLGKSYISNRDVSKTILEKFPATALLSICALILSAFLGIIIGVISAVKPHSFMDNTAMLFALTGISIPQFAFGLILVLFFGSLLKWFPVSGYISDGMEYLILPVMTLALRPLALISRLTRSSLLDVLSKDYIRTARAKGLSKTKVIIKHALRNSLNPVVTTISASLAATLGGAFFVEFIFNWPGIGLLAIDSIMKLDYPMIQGTVLFSAVVFVIINFLVDIVYAILDPKVKLS